MIVLDASAAVELLLNLPLGAEVRRRLDDPGVQLHAPHLLVVEVLQVLRRREAAGTSTHEEVADAVDFLEMLDVTYHDHLLCARRVWELRSNLTAYDATYVALAELLDVALLTSDARLARAPGHHARIDLLPT
ncbi:type II toxin-antitoxin system VapC family toxin [Georgenia sp. Z1344]|uniref:type II toxin-antitoxin system VapC family toxin n=1 Tax=Georgenia sp. Z1344 TaxID=3416706 RepID=UPI003CF371BB